MRTITAAAVFLIAAGTALAHELSYSAIAISPNTGDFGRGFDFPTQEQAESYAMDLCHKNSKQPDDCRVVARAGGDDCAAVAVHYRSDGSVIWGSATAASREEAESAALAECARQFGAPCDYGILDEVCAH
jgi:Domain of unknown function (DUF4189)